VTAQGPPDAADPAPRRGRGRFDRLLGEAAAPSPARPPRPEVDAPGSLRRAALVVALEAALLGVLGVYLLVLTVVGDPDSVGRALAEVVIVGAAAALLAACARGLRRVSGWSRAPVVVVQILLGLLGYQAAVDFERPLLGLPILVLVVLTLYLLATPESRLAFLERDET
jgi:hypothetical protein